MLQNVAYNWLILTTLSYSKATNKTWKKKFIMCFRKTNFYRTIITYLKVFLQLQNIRIINCKFHYNLNRLRTIAYTLNTFSKAIITFFNLKYCINSIIKKCILF